MRRQGKNLKQTARKTFGYLTVLACLIVSQVEAVNASPFSRFSFIGKPAHIPPGSVGLGPLVQPSAMRVDIFLAPEHAGLLRAYATDVGNPNSPDFRHFLSPQQFAAEFGTPPSAIAAVEANLSDQELTVTSLSASHLILHARGTVGAIEKAFATPITSYRLADGKVGYANNDAPRLPRSIAGDVDAIVGLDSFTAPSPMLLRAPRQGMKLPQRDVRILNKPLGSSRSDANISGPQPTTTCATQIRSAAGAPPTGLYSVSNLAQVYGFDDLYGAGDTGQGATIALIEFAPYLSPDITSFEQCFTPQPTPVITNTFVDGGAGPPGISGPGINVVGEEEAELDIETVLALAPSAAIDIYEGPESSDATILDTYAAAIDNPAVEVISTSWGACEAATDSSLVNGETILFEQAAAEGKTVVAAAGDQGSSDCYQSLTGSFGSALAVDDPASQPFVTGVGGTYLSSIGPPPTETVWNGAESDGLRGGAGGGGISSLWPMPDYQLNAPRSLGVASDNTACDLVGGECRAVPDVASDAGAPIAVFCTEGGPEGCEPGGWSGFGGTSIGSPTWGSLVALSDASSACGGVSVGFANPLLYTIAESSAYGSSFTDITVGNNDLLGIHKGQFSTSAGYDLASGLGSPIAGAGSDTGLVADLCSTRRPAPTTTTTTTTTTTVPVPASTTTPPQTPFRAKNPPRVSRVSPREGTDNGGTVVSITGENFVKVHAVRFGRTRARSFNVISKSTIVAISPSGRGIVAVTVTTAGGSSKNVRTDEFTYIVKVSRD